MFYKNIFQAVIITAILLSFRMFPQEIPVSLRLMNIRVSELARIPENKKHKPNCIEFDVYLKNQSSRAVMYALGQYYFQMRKSDFNDGIAEFGLKASGLPEKMQFAEIAPYTVGDSIQLCCPARIMRGRRRDFKIPAGDSVLIGTFVVRTDAQEGFKSMPPNIKIRTYRNAGFPFTKMGVYVDDKAVDVWKTCTYYFVE
jgi:hypothetical protein